MSRTPVALAMRGSKFGWKRWEVKHGEDNYNRCIICCYIRLFSMGGMAVEQVT